MYAPLSMRSPFVALVQALCNNLYVNTKSPARLFSQFKNAALFSGAPQGYMAKDNDTLRVPLYIFVNACGNSISHIFPLGKEREREKVHSTLLLSCFVA
jgi:hypothetical protein